MIDPKMWGPPMWSSLIYIAQGYPDRPTSEDQNDYQQFYLSLGPVLPCGACKLNYLNHYKHLPIQLQNRAQLLDWLHKMYNLVLQEQQQSTISYEQFLKKHLNSGHPLSQLVTFFASPSLGLALCFLILLYFLYNYFFKAPIIRRF